MKKSEKDRIREFVLGMGVEDVGFASVKDYNSPNSPLVESFFPEIKSFIIMVFPELNNCESNNKQLAFSGRDALGEFAKSCNYRLGNFLRKEFGAKVMSISPVGPFDTSRGPIADVSLRHVAVAAGLGNFGRHNLIIHPKLGTRIIFAAVMTDLELDSDPSTQESLCIDCDLCVNNCPVQALSEPGKTDVLKCFKHSQPYGMIGNIQFWQKFIASTPEKQKELLSSPEYGFLYQAMHFETQYYCFNCFTSCPVGRN